MHSTLQPTTSADKPIFTNLMQLHLHDLSALQTSDVNKQGLFHAPELDQYWSEPRCAAFLIKVKGHLAGFTLINPHSRVQTAFDGKVVSAFFVLRRYRRQGIGRAAAIQLFDMYPGMWEIASLTTNVPAHCFWRSVLQTYTDGHYSEAWHHQNGWRGHIQTFVTPRAQS